MEGQGGGRGEGLGSVITIIVVFIVITLLGGEVACDFPMQRSVKIGASLLLTGKIRHLRCHLIVWRLAFGHGGTRNCRTIRS